ncbi:MAG: hypothetical protein LBC19_09185 [Tannerella sp.]|jgi:hypothetical protein|nr:hypothetical protein [Tannerella sp.]
MSKKIKTEEGSGSSGVLIANPIYDHVFKTTSFVRPFMICHVDIYDHVFKTTAWHASLYPPLSARKWQV